MAEELYEPLERYRDELKAAHRANAEAMFAELAEASGVDAGANAKTCAEAERLGHELKDWKRRKGWRLAAEVALWVALAVAVLAAVAGVTGFPDGARHAGWMGWGTVGAGLAGALLGWGARPAVKRAAGKVSELKAALAGVEAEAEAQMAGLNGLFDWDMPGKLSEKTLPGVKFDGYFSEGRLRDLRETFGWNGEGFGKGSVLWAQSGEINGNPFVVGRVVEQAEGTKTYKGTKRISWRARVPDGNGGWRWETRHETLVATVEKPMPTYPERSFVLFANDAAERLEFTRAPSPMAKETPGTRGCERALKRCVKKLEKFARNLDDRYGFTMSDPEFEAYFQAWDRNDEVQFRLLYTVLAQRQLLALLKDRSEGFGDDFEMQKRGRINVLWPKHLDGACLDGNPARWRSRSFATAKEKFVEGNAAWFRHAYFALAPLLAVPLYQQTRSHETIWRSVLDRASASPEHEALANFLGEGRWKHPGSVTRNILKAAARRGADGRRRVEITALGFRTEERVDQVPVWGQDGNRHLVDVPWLEYLPVERTSEMRVVDAPGKSRRECEAAPPASGFGGEDLAGLIYRRAVLGG
ncbi:MAG: hypothetical protein IK066_04585 [Kiritimatiellae bacterium]|nr:hypothetical protein [Kiritimatiellia bacterium]